MAIKTIHKGRKFIIVIIAITLITTIQIISMIWSITDNIGNFFTAISTITIAYIGGNTISKNYYKGDSDNES
ncbi:MAG: hypothetical protein ACRC0A_01560 [Chitinophagaceae bacterium]